MKKINLLVISIFLLQFVNCQIETRFFPEGNAQNEINIIKNNSKSNKILRIPFFDIQKLIDEDNFNNANMSDIPFRFGKGFDIDISFSDGEWIDVVDHY